MQVNHLLYKLRGRHTRMRSLRITYVRHIMHKDIMRLRSLSRTRVVLDYSRLVVLE